MLVPKQCVTFTLGQFVASNDYGHFPVGECDWTVSWCLFVTKITLELSLFKTWGKHDGWWKRLHQLFCSQEASHQIFTPTLSFSISTIVKRSPDVTKVWGRKSEQLLRIDDHDFTMRPGFGGKSFIFLEPSKASPHRADRWETVNSFLRIWSQDKPLAMSSIP